MSKYIYIYIFIYLYICRIGEDSVSSLGNCLQNNKVTKLCFMKLGELQCREQTFIKLIQRGLSTCLNLKYLYLISPQHFKNEIISHTNSSFVNIYSACISYRKIYILYIMYSYQRYYIVRI